MIHDTAGFTIVDWTYVHTGLAQGWLTLDGFHFDAQGVLVYRYVMV